MPAAEGPSKEEAREAVQALLTCFYLYDNYTVGSRGPSGLIIRALRCLDPEAARRVENDDDWESLLDAYDSDD